MTGLYEIGMREGLAFFGALIGLIWGYMLGVNVERRRWRASLQPALEALGAGVVGTKDTVQEARR